MLHDIQKHQVAFLSGAPETSVLGKQIEEDIRSSQEVDGRYGKELKTTHGLTGLAEKWAATKSLILRNSSFAKPVNINSVYDDIVGKSILPLIIQVGNTSHRILDPDLDSYYAMDNVINELPELGRLIAQANAHATDLILTRENSESKKQLIAFILARIEPAMETINNGLQASITENPSLRRQALRSHPYTHRSGEGLRRYAPASGLGCGTQGFRKNRSEIHQRERIENS